VNIGGCKRKGCVSTTDNVDATLRDRVCGRRGRLDLDAMTKYFAAAEAAHITVAPNATPLIVRVGQPGPSGPAGSRRAGVPKTIRRGGP
jgi:hypothetical protein